MNDDRYKGLSETERDALDAMASGAVPRAGLEDDTVGLLSSHGLIGTRKRGIVMKVSAAVAALVAVSLVFVAGVTVGKRGGDTATAPVAVAPPEGRQYMLLLFETPAEAAAQEPPSGEELLAIIDEYRQWGNRLAEAGRLVGAEKLKDDAFVMSGEAATRLESAPEDGRVLGGYFLIRAANMDDARDVASTHPHLKYGGEIEIRPLDLHD
jgi:hypothetical protein